MEIDKIQKEKNIKSSNPSIIQEETIVNCEAPNSVVNLCEGEI